MSTSVRPEGDRDQVELDVPRSLPRRIAVRRAERSTHHRDAVLSEILGAAALGLSDSDPDIRFAIVASSLDNRYDHRLGRPAVRSLVCAVEFGTKGLSRQKSAFDSLEHRSVLSRAWKLNHIKQPSWLSGQYQKPASALRAEGRGFDSLGGSRFHIGQIPPPRPACQKIMGSIPWMAEGSTRLT